MSIRQSIFALSLAAAFLSLAVLLCLAIIFFLVFRGAEEPDRELVQIPTASIPQPTTVPPTVMRQVLPTTVPQSPTPIPTATPSLQPVIVPGKEPVMPFTNIAREALGKNAFVNNWHPGSAFFDFDRDGDMDFYVTQANSDSEFPESPGGPNLLFATMGTMNSQRWVKN